MANLHHFDVEQALTCSTSALGQTNEKTPNPPILNATTIALADRPVKSESIAGPSMVARWYVVERLCWALSHKSREGFVS